MRSVPLSRGVADRPIGVFDSGIGGLTVMHSLMERLPRESLIYFGDTARVPYGPKSKDTVTRFSIENVHLLTSYDVKVVVVACNTATARALPALREEFHLPIVGVVGPGARAAAGSRLRPDGLPGRPRGVDARARRVRQVELRQGPRAVADA